MIKPRGRRPFASRRAPVVLSALAFVLTAAAAPALADDGERFNVFEYGVRGNSVLDREAIENAVMPHMGEARTVKDVEAARVALEKAYHDRGYLTVTVDIPEQKVDQGVVALQVNEGTVGRVRVVGSRYYSLGHILATVPSLAEGRTPHFPTVQQQLAQVNRTPDRRVTPVLRPSDTPGKVDIELKVKDELPLHGGLQYDNRHSANTSFARLAGFLRYDNLWQRDHSLSLRYEIAPHAPEESKVWSLSYVAPAPAGRTYAFYAVRSRSDVAAIGDLRVLGNGDLFGARLIQPLPAEPDARFNHSLSFGIDYKDFDQIIDVGDGVQDRSPIKYIPLSLAYNASSYAGDHTSTYELGLNVLLRPLAEHPQQFSWKRERGDASYTVLRGSLQRRQRLGGAWHLWFKADGQLASNRLISNEQFSAGGADSVRGYLEAEEIAEDGLRGSLELETPPFLEHPFYREAPHFIVFADGARLRTHGASQRQALASLGFGMRARTRNGFGLALDAARVLNSGPHTEAGRVRALFMVDYGF